MADKARAVDILTRAERLPADGNGSSRREFLRRAAWVGTGLAGWSLCERSGAGVVELGVKHYPRTAGQARGANPRVIAHALYELVRMYRRLERHGVETGPKSGARPSGLM